MDKPSLVKLGRKKPTVKPTTKENTITVQNLEFWLDSVPVHILNKKRQVPRKPAKKPIYSKVSAADMREIKNVTKN